MLLREDSPERAPRTPNGPLAELTGAGLVAVGVGLVVWAYLKAPTSGIGTYDPIFWAGMLLGYLAVAWRAAAGSYAVLWLGVLGLFTVLPKFWMSRGGPIYFDEIAHFSLLQNTISAGRLFQHTPTLPIGTYYPGLESAAAAIHWLTGLSTWDSALTLIAVAHCLLPIQIYYIARALPVSNQWAALAGVVYATNPSFIYVDAQFAYESLAILFMLTIIRLYVEALAAERSSSRTWRHSLSALLLIVGMIFGLVVTHHLTSLTGIGLLLAGALFLKPISGLADRKGGWRRLFVRWTPVLALATCFGLWVAFVAPGTVSYLLPFGSGTLKELVALGTHSKSSLAGHSQHTGAVRAIFSGSAGLFYERAAAILADVIIAVAFLFAAIFWLRKPPLRANFLWSLVLAAAYLVSLPLTLIGAGERGSHRTWASTFVGVALLPTALVILSELGKGKPWLQRAAPKAGAVALAVLLIGNVAAGNSVDYRFPGPYQFDSDTLSVTPETLSFAHWVQEHLGPGVHVVTDRFTALALTAHADAFTPPARPTLPTENIWYNHRPPGRALMSALASQKDDYLAIDVRDARYTAVNPPLFYPGEPKLVPLRNLTRMARWPWLRLLYSSRHYRLYQINFVSYFLWYPSHANER